VIPDERVPRELVDEQCVGRTVSRSEHGAERAVAGTNRVAVAQHAVGLEVRALADDVVEERPAT
jgi:hypothetical protein